MSEARALLGDLVVASVEVAESAADPLRWLGLASAAAPHVGDAPPALRDELFATLREHELVARVRGRFEDAWPRIAWDTICVMRSGFEAWRDIFEQHAPALVPQADMSRTEQRMIQHGDTLFVPLQIPDGTPRHHWWWRGGVPPGERATVMNERMRELLPPRGLHADQAPANFRALVARGFVEIDEMLFFRQLVPPHVPRPAGHQHESAIEADANVVHLAQVVEPDPGRRPVDTAAAAMACARHLAYELRRNHPPCRIAVNVHPSLNAVRFHRIRRGQDWATKDGKQSNLEHYTSAMLVLES